MRQRPLLAIAVGLLLILNTARAGERRFQRDLETQDLTAALKAVASKVNVKLRYTDDQDRPSFNPGAAPNRLNRKFDTSDHSC